MITNGLVKNRSVITHSNHSSQSPPLHEAFATLPGNVSFRRIRRYGIFHSLATSPNTNLSLSPVFFGFGRIWGSSPRKGRYVQLDGRGTVHSDEEEWTPEWMKHLTTLLSTVSLRPTDDNAAFLVPGLVLSRTNNSQVLKADLTLRRRWSVPPFIQLTCGHAKTRHLKSYRSKL
jgi:hypothetical protein